MFKVINWINPIAVKTWLKALLADFFPLHRGVYSVSGFTLGKQLCFVCNGSYRRRKGSPCCYLVPFSFFHFWKSISVI